MLRRCGWLVALASCFGTPPGATSGGGEACDVGELDCPCSEAMQCLGALVCIEGICRDAQGTGETSSPGTMGTNTTATDATGSADTSTSLTETSTTSVVDTTGAVTTTGEPPSTSAGTGSLCADGTCNECYTCAMADDGPCGSQADACDMDVMMAPPPCYNIWYGVQMCEGNPSCTSCPEPTDAGGMALLECLVDECGPLDCKCV